MKCHRYLMWRNVLFGLDILSTKWDVVVLVDCTCPVFWQIYKDWKLYTQGFVAVQNRQELNWFDGNFLRTRSGPMLERNARFQETHATEATPVSGLQSPIYLLNLEHKCLSQIPWYRPPRESLWAINARLILFVSKIEKKKECFKISTTPALSTLLHQARPRSGFLAWTCFYWIHENCSINHDFLQMKKPHQPCQNTKFCRLIQLQKFRA